MIGYNNPGLGQWQSPTDYLNTQGFGLGQTMPSLSPAIAPTNTGMGFGSPGIGSWGNSGMPSTLGADSGGGGFFGSMLSTKDQQGWLSPALGVAQGIAGLVMGSKQYKLAKDSLAQSQRQFDQNYAAQRQTTNTALEDRQRARVAAGGNAYESVDSYMARNRIN